MIRHARLAGQRVLVLIDEYDNFANDLLARGASSTYREMVHATGFVRTFYKALKEGTETVIDRMFVTGVSPIMLDDLTSGFNIATNLSLQRVTHDLHGFTQEELRGVVSQLSLPAGHDVEATLREMTALYNGYRFHPAAAPLYNPDMVLHFARLLIQTGEYPEEVVDPNVKTDYGRLRQLLQTGPDNVATVSQLLADESIQREVVDQFSFERMHDGQHFVSLLFYLGMLSMDAARRGRTWLKIPNYAIKTVYWEYLRRLLEERHEIDLHTQELSNAIEALAWEGEATPFAEYVAHEVLGKLSRRDFRQFGEKHIKAIIFALIGLTDFYVCHSEAEVEHGFLDLFLSRDPRYPELPYEWLLELKHLKEEDRAQLGAVKEQALSQLATYADSREIRARFRGDTLRMAALVFIGKGEVEVVVA